MEFTLADHSENILSMLESIEIQDREKMSNGEPIISSTIPNTHNTSNQNLKVFKRDPQHRIFVNRGLHLDKIKFYGFDMDYTLAVYKSPVYESMGFDHLKARLVDIGYPTDFLRFEFDPAFPVRGLWFDKIYGNLLKVDSHGNILVCIHGFRFLKPHEVQELYPNKYIQLEDSRLYVLNTLFNIPETYMLACIINYFETNKEYSKTKTGVTYSNIHMSFKSIFQDARAAVDWLHSHGDLKSSTMANLEKYVHKDDRLPILLDRIRQIGAKTVLITNSGYEYTDKIMTYLLDFPEKYGSRHWTSYWDCVVVDAMKPLFFEDGTILRVVDTETGALSIGHHLGPLKSGEIYSGGSCEVVSRLLGAKGSDVLYVGDHIFGDILKSKKIRGWRTFLIIPELTTELQVWTEKKQLFDNLTRIESALSDIYKHLDSSTLERPDTSIISQKLRAVVHELDMSYGMLGSLFRSGSRQTFFASQVRRYADIYAASILNLLHYPFCYMFRAPAMLMPHEATVDHYSVNDVDSMPIVFRSRSSSDAGCDALASKRPREKSTEQAVSWPEPPLKVVHIHDDGDSEEDNSESSLSLHSVNSSCTFSPDTEHIN
ncbi:cytosolic purine 5'-nucleotidase-like isoform X1 [Biomphalaria glabrata]|uniref:Cytosolic purine 5'-nucleotidase-like isoform X1 n=1 Tax=Biomphalaria glabrata TaxID=6526 RepID=A0A9W2Z9P5_BIOGL|nr:cytosolic purine 5'-nucleotidase-like isoform X1 [Biomphalaria glabrata]